MTSLVERLPSDVVRSETMEFGDRDGIYDRVEPTFLPEPGQRELWCPMISADDHVLEPPDLFRTRLSGRIAESAPAMVLDETGTPYWRIDGLYYPIAISNGAVGRPAIEWRNGPQKYSDFREGVADTAARVADMDLNGVWASLCFPSFVWGFAGRRFSSMSDPEVGLASLRAYNDWMIDEWCGSFPERFIPCQVPWLSDPEIAAGEVRANAERGFRAISFPETPDRLGHASLHAGAWDPFFRACEETDTVINLHVGSSGFVMRPSEESPGDVPTALFPINGLAAMVDWLYARIPIKFPEIKIVLSEAGVSWVPMMMERLTRAYRHTAHSEVWSTDDPHPNELLKRNFWFTSIEDPYAFQSLDLIGADRIMLESDYPHQDSTWPDTQALMKRDLEHLDADTVRMIAFGTAAEVYRHQPPPAEWLERSTLQS